MKVNGYKTKVYYHSNGSFDSPSSGTYKYCDAIEFPELKAMGISEFRIRWRDGHAPWARSVRELNEICRKEAERHIDSLIERGYLKGETK